MKKIFLLLCSFIFIGALQAQLIPKIDDNNSSSTYGFYTWVSNDEVLILNGVSIPVGKLVLPMESVFSGSLWSRKQYGGRDTVGTSAPDSLSRKIGLDTSNSIKNFFDLFSQGWFASDDTIIVSDTITFPANRTVYIYPSESETAQMNNLMFANNIYWKSYGTGIASVRWKRWGF